MTLIGGLRALGIVLGVLLVLVGALANRDETGRVQSVILDAWVRLGDVGERATTRHVRFVNRVARSGLAALSWFLGDAIISVRMLWATLCLSSASLVTTFVAFLLGFAWLFYRSSYSTNPLLADQIPKMAAHGVNFHSAMSVAKDFFLFACGIVGLSFIQALLLGKRRRWTAAVMVALISLGAMYSSGLLVSWAYFQESVHAPLAFIRTQILVATYLAPFLLVGVLSDVATIAATRWALRRGADAEGWITGVITLAGMCLVGAAVSWGLLAVGAQAILFGHGREVELLGALIAISVSSNLFDIALVFLVVANLALLLLHRSIWPVVVRPLERVYEVVPSRKAVVAIGLALLSVSTSTGLGFLKSLLTAAIK